MKDELDDWIETVTLQEEFEDLWCRRFNRVRFRKVGKFWRGGRWQNSRLTQHGNRYVKAFGRWRDGR